jgi:hypothetical protein
VITTDHPVSFGVAAPGLIAIPRGLALSGDRR